MKTKIMLAIGGTLLLAAVAFSSISAKSVSSFKELTAQATGACVPASNADCKSSATGNIYIGYTFVPDPIQ